LGGYSWGALSPKSTGRILEIRSRLFRLVEEFKREGYSTRDIYWLGHSQGALIASDLVLHHPEAFGAMIGVSGYVWLFRGWQSALKSSGAKRTPWLFTHGSRDRVIPLSEIRNDVKALTKGRVPVSMREFNKGHDFDYEAEVPFIGEWIRHASMELNS
jgi:predicted esterase